MSAIQANNENKTVFNIIMDNGLPYKNIIRCETTLFKQEGNDRAGIIHLELPNPSPIDDELDHILNSHHGIKLDEELVQNTEPIVFNVSNIWNPQMLS